MPSLKMLRNRIKSVKSTQQITRTMKMVAAAKVKRARNACDAARPYAQRMQKVLSNLAKESGNNIELLHGREDVKTVRLIVFGADRGLCGGFNVNLHKKLISVIQEHQAFKRKVEIVAIGKKAKDAVRISHPDLLVGEKINVSKNLNFDLAEEIATETMEAFDADQCDSVHVVFVECVSMLTQTATVQQLIPFAAPEEEEEVSFGTEPEYEPSEEEILSVLLPRNVKVQVFRAMLDSAASEQAARMTAMDNATRNAGDMIKDLSLKYNRSRQAAITSELIEIISGAQAL